LIAQAVPNTILIMLMKFAIKMMYDPPNHPGRSTASAINMTSVVNLIKQMSAKEPCNRDGYARNYVIPERDGKNGRGNALLNKGTAISVSTDSTWLG
jgi:hypothetical protein